MNRSHINPPVNVLILVDLIGHNVINVRSVRPLVLDLTIASCGAIKKLACTVDDLNVEFWVKVKAIWQRSRPIKVFVGPVVKVHDRRGCESNLTTARI